MHIRTACSMACITGLHRLQTSDAGQEHIGYCKVTTGSSQGETKREKGKGGRLSANGSNATRGNLVCVSVVTWSARPGSHAVDCRATPIRLYVYSEYAWNSLYWIYLRELRHSCDRGLDLYTRRWNAYSPRPHTMWFPTRRWI